MITPRLILDLPESGGPMRFAPLVIALEALTKINEYHLQKSVDEGRPLPRLYESGLVYREEKGGAEDWPDAPTLLRQGWGDCEDLAAYLAAERRVYDGVDAEPIIRWKHIPAELIRSKLPNAKIPDSGIYLVHCLVRYADGSTEDPSKALGMRGEY